MSLADSLFELVTHIGGGIGGAGFLAALVYTRFRAMEKDTTAAKALAADASKLVADITDDVEDIRTQIKRLTHGSLSEITHAERFTGLETRMSALEDDNDTRSTEDRKAWEEILRAVGRLEGRLGKRE